MTDSVIHIIYTDTRRVLQYRLHGSVMYKESCSCIYIIIYIVFYIYMCACGKPWVKGYQQGARNPWLSVLANEDRTARGWKRTCKFLISDMARWLSYKPPLSTWHGNITWHDFISSHFILSLRGVSKCVLRQLAAYRLYRCALHEAWAFLWLAGQWELKSRSALHMPN